MKLRFVLAVLFTIVSPHVYADDVNDCMYSSGDTRISACTRGIESGIWQGINLSGAYNNRGIAWQNKGDTVKAIADYNEAIRLDPKCSNAYYNRGIAQFGVGEFSLAATDLAQSQQLRPDTYTAIWLYLARARSSGEDKAELALNTNGMDGKKWPAPVVAIYLDKTDFNTVISQAADSDPKKHKEQVCEANFYLGEWYLLRDEKKQANTLLVKAQSDCPKHFSEYTSAVSELKRLK